MLEFQEFVIQQFKKQDEFNKYISTRIDKLENKVDNLSNRIDNLVKVNNLKE
jgi:tetrahydromethanopterin S-methyltransferase subunit G